MNSTVVAPLTMQEVQKLWVFLVEAQKRAQVKQRKSRPASSDYVFLKGLASLSCFSEKLCQFDALLLEHVGKINLLSRASLIERYQRHYLDSLQLFLPLHSWLQDKNNASDKDNAPEKKDSSIEIIDLGSGAGFPALPLAIFCPTWRFTLIEATGKKGLFLQKVVNDLALQNCRMITQRIEDLEPIAADVVIARALAPLERLLRYGYHIAPKATFFFHKGKRWKEELARSRGIKIRQLHAHVSLTDGQARILQIKP